MHFIQGDCKEELLKWGRREKGENIANNRNGWHGKQAHHFYTTLLFSAKAIYKINVDVKKKIMGISFIHVFKNCFQKRKIWIVCLKQF